MSDKRRLTRPLAALLFALGAWQIGGGAYVYAKAALGERLIAQAFQSARASGAAEAAWPWADARPVSRLEWHEGGVTRHVLDSTSGEALAWGAGQIAPPEGRAMVALAGHRDTHFAFLQQVRAGHRLTLTSLRGSATRYVVTGTRVVDQHDVAALDLAPENGLVLVTCYPFTAVAASPNTPWRLLVLAKREGPALAPPTAEALTGPHQRRPV